MDTSFDDREKRFILAEMVKASHLDVGAVISFVKHYNIAPDWLEMQIPHGKPRLPWASTRHRILHSSTSSNITNSQGHNTLNSTSNLDSSIRYHRYNINSTSNTSYHRIPNISNINSTLSCPCPPLSQPLNASRLVNQASMLRNGKLSLPPRWHRRPKLATSSHDHHRQIQYRRMVCSHPRQVPPLSDWLLVAQAQAARLSSNPFPFLAPASKPPPAHPPLASKPIKMYNYGQAVDFPPRIQSPVVPSPAAPPSTEANSVCIVEDGIIV
ncbi:hypothetical protein Sste5344_005368 [Sporothrix stenoceras]